MDIKDIVAQSEASLDKKDLELVLKILQDREINNILEIGTWKGFSTRMWIQAFAPQFLVTIEKDMKLPDAVEVEHPDYHYLWYRDSGHGITKEEVQRLKKTREFDLLFIDGGHLYQEVRLDWINYSPMVKQGGVILFHDIKFDQELCQVSILWERLKEQYHYVEVRAGNGSTGFGILFYEPDATWAKSTL